MKQLLPAAATSAAGPATRRSWLKRLGAALGGGLLARAAAASPTEVQTSNEPYVGEIIMIAGTYAPRGYALCQGQLLPISQNAALYALLGTQYGGDGRTTFALPNLSGNTPLHTGGGYQSRPVVNGESQTLTASQLPTHTHNVLVSSAAATSASPAGQVRATTAGTNVNGETVAVQAYATAPNAQAAATAIGTAGGGQAATLQSPYIAINFCIALVGIFPQRK